MSSSTIALNPPVPFASRVGLVFRTALPLMLASGLQVMIQFSNFYFMGHSSFQAIYLLSLYTPISFFVLAVLDSVSITNQVATAKKFGERQLGGALPITLNLAVVGMALMAALGLVAYLDENRLGAMFSVVPASRAPFARFVVGMIFSSVAMLPGMLVDSTLRGLGRVNLAFLLLLGYAVTYIVLVAFFARRLHLEEWSLIYASLICAIGLFFATSLVLVRLELLPMPKRLVRLAPEAMILLRWVGLPIFLSYLLIFISSFFYNRIVAGFGEASVAGFGIAYRIQILVILPALALGEAISLLMNHRSGAKRFAEAYGIFRVGIIGSMLLYVVVTSCLLIGKAPLVGLFTHDPKVLEPALEYLATVAPSYCWMGVLLTTLIVLEQTDNGFRAFLMNLVYFALIVCVGKWLTVRYAELIWFYRAFALFNCLGVFVILYETRRQRKKWLALEATVS